MDDVERRFWPVRKTATYLGVSERTVRGLVSRGEIGAIRVNAAVRVDRHHLERWILTRRYTALRSSDGVWRRLRHGFGRAAGR